MNYLKTYFFDIIFKKFFNFTGKADRPEFWLFALNVLVIEFILFILVAFSLPFLGYINTNFTNHTVIFLLTALCYIPMILLAFLNILIIFPSLGLSVRRLRDANFSVWWILLLLLPKLGKIIFLIFMCFPSKEESNVNMDNNQNIEQGENSNNQIKERTKNRGPLIVGIIILVLILSIFVISILFARKLNVYLGTSLINRISQAELKYFEQNNNFLLVDRTGTSKELDIDVQNRNTYNEFLCTPSVDKDTNRKYVEIKILRKYGKRDNAGYVSMSAIQYDDGELTEIKEQHENLNSL